MYRKAAARGSRSRQSDCAGSLFDHIDHDVRVRDGDGVRRVHLNDVRVGTIGLLVHVADVSGSFRAAKSMGRWVANIRAATLSGTSAARSLRYLSAWQRAYVPLVPSGKVYVVRSTDEAN